MNTKNKFLLLIGLLFTIPAVNCQPIHSNPDSVNCSTWDCIEENKNQEAIISGVFQKYTPNKTGKGANHMFWNWEIRLADGSTVPVNSTFEAITYPFFEGKKVRIRGAIFYGIIKGDPGSIEQPTQYATGFRIDPVEIQEAGE